MTIRINRVYTRKGDGGDTALVGGETVRKSCLQVETYGEIDELNSVLGVVKELVLCGNSDLAPISTVIAAIQQELFDLGSELATPVGKDYPGMPKTTSEQVRELERLCDCYSEGLPELTSFILPGGSIIVANLHVARAVARRVERCVVRFFDVISEAPQPNIEIVRYLNRLNDLIFILARWCLQKEGRDAPLWNPRR